MIDEEQMSDPDIAHTIRAMFIIDPSHRLRLSMLYPVSTGRSIRLAENCFQLILKILFKNFFLSFNSEILRVIDSLQLSDRIPYVVTPTDWVVCVSFFRKLLKKKITFILFLISSFLYSLEKR